MIVKICGITAVEDARAAAEAGADWIGLNFSPTSRRCVPREEAARIADAVRAKVKIVGVFVNQPRTEIEETARAVGLELVQLHGDEPEEAWQDLAWPVIRAVRFRAGSELPSFRRAAYVLVDSYVPGTYGGSGQVAPWREVRDYAWSKPVILAGGLDPDNVAEAIRVVAPFGVDVATGVEVAPGKKDPVAMRRFVEHAKTA